MTFNYKILHMLVVAAMSAAMLFSCHSGQQDARQMAEAIEDTASSKEAYFRTMTKIAYAKYLKGETQSSLEYAYIALGRSIEERFQNYEATLAFLIGINKANIGEYDDAVPYFRRAISIFNAMPTPQNQWNGLYQKVYTLLNTELVMQNAGKYDEALRILPDLNRSFRLLAECPDTASMKAGANSTFGFMPRSAFKLAKSSETTILELQQQQQETELRTMRIALIMGGVIVLLLIFIVFRIVRYNRIITRKNASAVDTINRLLQYRKALMEERSQHEQSKEIEDETKDSETEESTVEDTTKQEVDVDHELFDRIANIIMARKLFLQPKLTREDIINEVYVPHNKFAQLFTRYAGMSFTKFINDLRLEYAAQLLRDRPDYTIEAIGEECGMPIAQTFYRNFSDKFGVTPSDFRTLSQKKDRENQVK
ncbi:MAG: helix-turn-helix transcriptional regulator [Segatella sp.]|jgi:transcriptional regulator|nr:helix-turn-helix transcriptional regulator [Segatella oris]